MQVKFILCGKGICRIIKKSLRGKKHLISVYKNTTRAHRRNGIVVFCSLTKSRTYSLYSCKTGISSLFIKRRESFCLVAQRILYTIENKPLLTAVFFSIIRFNLFKSPLAEIFTVKKRSFLTKNSVMTRFSKGVLIEV